MCNVPIYYFLLFEGEKKSRGRPAGLSATAAAVPVREKDGCRGGSPVCAFLSTDAVADCGGVDGEQRFERGGGGCFGWEGRSGTDGGAARRAKTPAGRRRRMASLPCGRRVATPPRERARAVLREKKRPAARANPASKRTQPPRLIPAVVRKSFVQSVLRVHHAHSSSTPSSYTQTRAESHYF